MKKIKCPKCGRRFDNDALKRYTIGTIKDVAKFSTVAAMKLSASAAVGLFSQNGHLAHSASYGAGEFAKGLGLTNYDGWAHECPYCHHKWEEKHWFDD